MARAFPQTSPQDYERDRGGEEWQSLRGELVSLLEQVESKVARSGRDEAGGSISERMRALQAQLNEEPPVRRHQEALRSVQRAVDRFSDRDDGDYSPAASRDSIQSAISQIRSRQGDAVLRSYDAPRVDQMAQAVESLGRRLEGLEGEIRTQLRSSSDIKGVADQVSQLAHVVELLAGAVGETGQVKRLEGQLAAVAKLIAQGREADASVLTRRLDDVSATVGRLADLQVQYAGRVENPAQSAAFKDGMQAIEASVRNVYDRIDTLERSSSVAPDQIDNLLAEMARFTEAMKDAGTGASPQNLVELIDALNSRISEMETGDHLLSGLRKDLTALRDAVLVSLEPRFAALERKIDYLGSKYDLAGLTASVEVIGSRIAAQPIDSGIGHVEAQVRQLVARMDQTGEQLAGLAKLYAAGTGDGSAREIDINAIADAVAARTSDVVAQRLPQVAASSDLSGVRDIIGEVNLRLARLETALLEWRAAGGEPDEALRAGIADIIEQAEGRTTEMAFDAVQTTAARTGRDAMPKSPVVDVPLNAPPFPDPEPVRSALESKQNRKMHPGLEQGQGLAERYADPAPMPPKPEPAGFEVEDAAPMPPAPKPDLGIFEPSPMPAPVAQAPVAASSRNTFIEAARRAAQRQTPHKAAEANPNSLIGRALSRFQTNGKPADEPDRTLAGDKPARTKWAPEPVVAEPTPEPDLVMATETVEIEGEAGNGPKGSFIGRNRKVILLGAVLVVMVLLAANLVLQRVGGGKAPAAKAPAAEATDTVTTGAIGDEPAANALATELPAPATSGPRVVLPAQGQTTGSIGPTATQAFAGAQPLPGAVAAASNLGSTDSAGLDPVTFELPPDGVGPLELRQAAANGDMRAQFEIAAIYTEGRAVPLDYAAAAVWYERAGLQGFAPAEYRLGSLYENGQGPAQDLEAAKLWYGRAAAAGNRMSMHNLAALYAGGQLGTQDFGEAAKWFEQAASLGLTDSQFNLGMLYARGLGVTQDLERSYKWFAIAARSGDKDAIAARDDIARSLDAGAVGRLSEVVAAWVPAPIDLAANFAPIGTWMDTFDPGETIDSRDIVLSVQRALGKLGFDVGTPDGLTGPKTAIAIKSFERATGMSEIGLINPRLLAVLGSQPV